MFHTLRSEAGAGPIGFLILVARLIGLSGGLESGELLVELAADARGTVHLAWLLVVGPRATGPQRKLRGLGDWLLGLRRWGFLLSVAHKGKGGRAGERERERAQMRRRP